MSQPAISKHLKVLERAGLGSRGRDAQRRPVRLQAKPLAEANQWLGRYRQYWEASFKQLDTLPALVKRSSSAGWGCTTGWTLEGCEIDLRVGGAYRYVWNGDGKKMGSARFRPSHAHGRGNVEWIRQTRGRIGMLDGKGIPFSRTVNIQ